MNPQHSSEYQESCNGVQGVQEMSDNIFLDLGCESPELLLQIADLEIEIERLHAELAALREHMAQHAPMELRSFDIRDAKPENPEKWA